MARTDIGDSKESQKLYDVLSNERKTLQKMGYLPSWYTTAAWQMFKKNYQVDGESGLYGRHKVIARTLSKYMPNPSEWENKFFTLMWGGILSPATPVLANVGTDRGMPVSCSGQYIGDSIEEFYEGIKETAILSKWGFGASAVLSDIRPRGSKISRGGMANGLFPVAEDLFITASKVSQGGARRGSVAVYLDVDHGDFWEMIDHLELKPDGTNLGWVITDDFCQRLRDGNEEANKRFQKIIYVKLVTGKGYLFFKDKANRHRPQMYKDLGLDIEGSNLCSEITLHSSKKYSFSCILSSLNLTHWNEIKDSSAVFDSMVFLDCLCSYFIDQSKGIEGLEKVREFTIKGRAVGLGVMGLGTLFQQEGIPFEDLRAQFFNNAIFKHIHDETLRASKWLAELHGEPEWCKGYGVRNTHRTALAPTKSTALLMGGVSEGISPEVAVVFDAASAAGEMRRITPVFLNLMKERGKFNKETVSSIINNQGSVQHLDWLTIEEKQVFRTSFEMNQQVLLRYASQRQKYICQGQALNFFVPEDGGEETVSKLLSEAVLDEDILSVYYIYSKSGAVVADECIACQA